MDNGDKFESSHIVNASEETGEKKIKEGKPNSWGSTLKRT